MLSTPETQSHADSAVIKSRRGCLGCITLNRPKVLNSLNAEMVGLFDRALTEFETDEDIRIVLVKGAGDKAFCAGGNIRAIYEQGKHDPEEPTRFWEAEYRLNARIARFPKPYVAFMDGIVMGGGAGLSVHGSHRIVTERTRFAMPEVGIGFIPDVGSSWFLTRRETWFGDYVALTGNTFGAPDAIRLGVADEFVPSASLADLETALSCAPTVSDPSFLSSVISMFSGDPGIGVLDGTSDDIQRLFSFGSIEDVIAALTADGSEFARLTLETLRRKSPTSLKVTLKLLRQGRMAKSLDECLGRELQAACETLNRPDFYEGVRAAIVDKDGSPRWIPSSVKDVDRHAVEAFFRHPARPLFSFREFGGLI